MSLLPTPSPTFVARSLSNDVYADLGEGYLLVVLFAFLGLVATHPSILAWKIPWTEEPGRLQSMGSLRVGHD